MNILSDGKSDGIVLMYAKSGTLYPIALTKENVETLDLTLSISLDKIRIINKPQGKLENIRKDD